MSRGAQDKEREIVRIVHTYTYVRRVEEAGLGLNLEARVRSREGKGEKCNLQGALLIECAFFAIDVKKGVECWRGRELETQDKRGRGDGAMAGGRSSYDTMRMRVLRAKNIAFKASRPTRLRLPGCANLAEHLLWTSDLATTSRKSICFESSS